MSGALLVLALALDLARAEPAGADTGAELPNPPPPVGAAPSAVLEVALAARELDLSGRIEAISGALLHVPYVSDPLGEGVLPDADPLVRYDAFDCLTYAEEVLALALAPDPSHAARVRLDLRYGGDAPTYANRHHFMELQWLPSAVARGWLRETTAEYGPVVVFEREVTPATWAAWGGRRRFAMPDEALPVGPMRLEYLTLETALEAVDRIRPGSVIMTVREDRPWVPIWISHVGFAVSGPEPTIRHATNMRSAMETRDHGLAWYLRHLMTYKNWKAVGIAIYEPIDPAPRATAARPP